MSFKIKRNQNIRLYIFRNILGRNTKKMVTTFYFFSNFVRITFGPCAKKFSAGLSKLLSTCPKEHFGLLKSREHVHSKFANQGEKKVYILREWFSFRNILRRKIIIFETPSFEREGNNHRSDMLHYLQLSMKILCLNSKYKKGSEMFRSANSREINTIFQIMLVREKLLTFCIIHSVPGCFFLLYVGSATYSRVFPTQVRDVFCV